MPLKLGSFETKDQDLIENVDVERTLGDLIYLAHEAVPEYEKEVTEDGELTGRDLPVPDSVASYEVTVESSVVRGPVIIGLPKTAKFDGLEWNSAVKVVGSLSARHWTNRVKSEQGRDINTVGVKLRAEGIEAVSVGKKKANSNGAVDK